MHDVGSKPVPGRRIFLHLPYTWKNNVPKNKSISLYNISFTGFPDVILSRLKTYFSIPTLMILAFKENWTFFCKFCRWINGFNCALFSSSKPLYYKDSHFQDANVVRRKDSGRVCLKIMNVISVANKVQKTYDNCAAWIDQTKFDMFLIVRMLFTLAYNSGSF